MNGFLLFDCVVCTFLCDDSSLPSKNKCQARASLTIPKKHSIERKWSNRIVPLRIEWEACWRRLRILVPQRAEVFDTMVSVGRASPLSCLSRLERAAGQYLHRACSIGEVAKVLHATGMVW